MTGKHALDVEPDLPSALAPAPSANPAKPTGDTYFAGTLFLTKLMLRLDWKHLLPWILLIPIFPASSAWGLKALEGTPGGSLNLGAIVSANPALTMLFGQPGDLDTVDGFVVWRTLLIGSIFAGLMGVYAMTRNVKAPEDNGQAELLASAPVGRFSRLSAGLIVSLVAAVALGLVTWAASTASGGTSLIMLKLGASYTMMAFLFACVAALGAQVFSSARAVNLGVGMLLTLAYVVRILADVPNSWTGWRWLSPFGWIESANLGAGLDNASSTATPMADLSAWPLAIGVVVAIVLASSSYFMQERRDFGAGLVAERSGPPHGFDHGNKDVALAALVWRLNRSTVFGWFIMLVLMGALVGMIFAAIGSSVLSNPAFTQLLKFRGVTLGTVELEFARLLLQVLALVSGLLGIRLANRFLEEEQATRVEILQALPLSRARTFAHFVIPALIISTAGFMASTIAIVASNNANGGHLEWGDAMALAVQMLPAVLVIVALAIFVAGTFPRWRFIADIVLVATLFVSILGPMLNFPDWVLKLSVLEQVPSPLDQDPQYAGIWILALLTAVLVVLGFIGVRRRSLR